MVHPGAGQKLPGARNLKFNLASKRSISSILRFAASFQCGVVGEPPHGSTKAHVHHCRRKTMDASRSYEVSYGRGATCQHS